MLPLNVGDMVRVSGKSQKGKNRIKEHGRIWKVKKIWTRKVLLETDTGLRWVDGDEDPDFKIEMVVDFLAFFDGKG